MVNKLLERAIEIEGLLRIIRDGNPLPETYTLLSNKAVELAEEVMMLEEEAATGEPQRAKEQETTPLEAATQRIAEQKPIATDTEAQAKKPESTPEVSEVPMIVMTPDPIVNKKEEENLHSAAPAIVMTVDLPATIHDQSQTELHEELVEVEEEEIVNMPRITDTISNDSTLSLPKAEFEEEEDDDILLTIEDSEDEEPNTPEIQIEQHIEREEKEEPEIHIKNEDKGKPAFKRQTKLKSAFSLNDRFLYARELFDGNMKMFDSTLDFIEGIEEYSIIEDYFYNELEWDPENMAVTSFMEILRPHFKE